MEVVTAEATENPKPQPLVPWWSFSKTVLAAATLAFAFYRALFRQRDGNIAFSAMNDAVAHRGKPFHMWTAEEAFEIANRHYFERRCSPEEVARRAETIAGNVAARSKAARGVGRYKWEMERDCKAAEAWLGDHRARFEELRRDFFFINEFPENDGRFDHVTFESCLPPDWPV